MNHATHSPFGQPRTPYSPVFSHNEIVDFQTSNQRASKSRRRWDWSSLESVCLRTLGYGSVLVVPLTLAIWLPRGMPDLRHFDIFQSVPLGGTLTLNQAKAVDFVISAVIAPLVLAVFNCAWFANARVSLANERSKRPKGTSLHALVEASSISAGCYDLVKLWALVSSRSVCLIVFASLTLTAAMGKSSLSNFIAYEAYKRPVDAEPVQLRLLAGPYMGSYDVQQATNNVTWIATHDQRKDFAQGTTEVLQGIAWQNSTELLTSGAYIALNVTSWELTQLDSSVVTLYNVPAINGTIDCQPQALADIQLQIWSESNDNGFTLQLDTGTAANASNGSPTSWSADVPAPLTVFQDGIEISTTSLDILAYNNDGDKTSMYIGSIGGVSGDKQLAWIRNNTIPVPTPFGPIQAQAFTIGADGACAQAGNCTMLLWGMVCTVKQRQGFVNLTRSLENPTWTKNSTSWGSDVEVRSSKLKTLARQLGTQSFKYMKAGLGPALTPAAETCNSSALQDVNSEMCSQPGPQHLNYQTLAHNLLWAEMAVQTVAFETGAMNASLATPNMFVTVPSTASIQYYRITYVPPLLFGGLICVFIAAVLSCSLLAYTSKTASGHHFRYVDSLRFLVDCAVSLQDEKLPSNIRSWSNHELLEWAQRFRLRYDAISERDGDLSSSTVIVTPTAKHRSENWPLS